MEKREDSDEWKGILEGIFFFFGYLGILALVAFAFSFLPVIQIEWQIYKDIYHSTSLSLFSVFYYMFLISSGYIYKVVCVLREKRKCIVANPEGNVWSYFNYLFVGSILFWLAPKINWYYDDLNLIYSYDFLTMTIPYVITQYFSYLDHGPLSKLVCTVGGFLALPLWLKIFFVLLCAGIGCCVLFELYLLELDHRLLIYIIAYFVLTTGLLLTAYFLRESYTLHIHHYVIGMLLVPFTSTRNRLSFLFQGVSLGLFTEGIARWGMDPIFEKKDYDVLPVNYH